MAEEYKELQKKRRAKRKTLFHRSRPNIRSFEWEDDIPWVWTSLKLTENNIDKDDFLMEMGGKVMSYDFIYTIEDFNKNLPEGHGPVALVYGTHDDEGLKYEPHVHYFPWANKKNVLRTSVAYFSKMRFSKEIGFISIFAKDAHENLFDRMWEYVDLKKIKSVSGFYHDSDLHIYFLRGGKEYAE